MKHSVLSNQRGQGLVEYALLISAAALTAVGILSLLGVQVRDVFCQVSEGIGGESLCSSVLFRDDFDNGSKNWHSPDGDNKNWSTTNGNNPELCHSGKGNTSLLANNSDGSDYTISVDANASASTGYGLNFRTSENENGQIEGYTFQYEPGRQGGQYVIRKWVNGYEIWPPIAAAPAPKEPRGQNVARHVELNVVDDRFTATIDGEEVLVGQDDSYQEGGTGLHVQGNGHTCFDNFTVTSH